MGDTHDLISYAQAKIYVNDIEKIMIVLNMAIDRLTPYSNYKPVGPLVYEMRRQRIALNTHLTKYKETVASKGKFREIAIKG